MANDPVGTISGVSSGIQWRDMVTQIISIESQRTVTPLQTRQTALTSAASAWTEFQTVVARFRDTAKAIRDGTTFNTFATSAGASPSTSRALVSLSADATANPGAYSIEVQQLASAEKLSGAVASSSTTALGVSGAFVINGSAVTVAASDSLTTLRDKLNTLNSGSTPTGVSASILRSSAGARLVLSADQTGSAGIQLVDDSGGTLQTLGFTDSSTSANITPAGLTQTNRYSSATATFALMLGISLPTPSTIKVGGQTITVDLNTESLSTIAAKINAASGSSDAATVVAETVGGRTSSRLQTSLAVEANAADAANSARTLAVLGFTSAGRGSVAQVVKSANTFTGGTDANAAAETLLTDLKAGGQSLGLSVGDVITVAGKRGDGSAVSRTLTVAADSTMQSLLDTANNPSTGFAAGTRNAVATLSNGQLVVTDGTAGDSQLGLSMTVAKSGGGTISLGSFGAANGGTIGRSRQINAGTDARFMIDDQVVTRSSNAVSDVVAGVTFNLLAAEPGTAVDVAVTRNLDDGVSRMQSFVSAYNDLRSWADNNVATGKRLAANSTLRSMVSTLSSTLLQSVTGLTGSYTATSMAGLSRDKTGVMSLDTTAFRNALTTSFDDVKHLFSQSGVPSDGEITFAGSTDNTKATNTPYAVNITQAATTASVTGSAFATYATSGTADTMSITDASSGNTGTVLLSNGDSLAKIVASLNSQFTTKNMNLVASASGGAVKITSNDYGTTGGFTVGYTPGTGDGTAQLGISATSYAGLNVAGTIGGVAATGFGRTLTGATGSASEGMQLTYTGNTARAAGTVAYSVGMGGMLYNVAANIARDVDGQAATLSTNATTQASALDDRILAAQERLARRKDQLTAQFIAMESAMSKAQSLSTALSSAINGLFTYNKVSG
jgi:flagellar hook-associated protein 2